MSARDTELALGLLTAACLVASALLSSVPLSIIALALATANLWVWWRRRP